MLSIAFGRRWLVLAAWSSAMALSAGGVCAQEIGAASSDADLRDQVRQLTALVQSLAEKDQAEIKALQSQVKALQAKLDAQAAVPAAGQTASGSLASASPPPQTVSNVATTRVEQNETHHFALKSDDGRYSIGFAGIVQFDGGDFTDFKAASKIVGSQELSNGINARRARIGVSGTAAGGWSYAFIYDGGNSQDTTAKGIQTAQIIYGGFGGVALELGYSSTYFTLDQSTSAGDLMFTERATPSNIATNFNAGISAPTPACGSSAPGTGSAATSPVRPAAIPIPSPANASGPSNGPRSRSCMALTIRCIWASAWMNSCVHPMRATGRPIPCRSATSRKCA